MTTQVNIDLTDRQRDVLERVDRRVPIKVIAGELNVSEARINQHIRALKDKFSVDSMNELVEHYRASADYDGLNNKRARDIPVEAEPAGNTAEGPAQDPYRNSLYRNSQLHDVPIFPDEGSRVDPGEIVFSDAHHVLIDAPWRRLREPVVVPTFLDGNNAVVTRLALMLGIAVGIVAAVILVVAATVTVSDVLEGKAAIRTDTQDQ